MFSKKPRNRKRHSKRSRRAAPTQREREPLLPEIEEDDSAEALRKKEFQLHARIDALERVIASHDEEVKQKIAMREQNILPPPDYGGDYHHEPAKAGNVHYPSAQRRKEKQNQSSSWIQFFILLLIAAGLLFWLLYTGG